MYTGHFKMPKAKHNSDKYEFGFYIQIYFSSANDQIYTPNQDSFPYN